MVKTSKTQYAWETGNEAYRAYWKCHLTKYISPFQMSSLTLLYFKLNAMQKTDLKGFITYLFSRACGKGHQMTKDRVSIVPLWQNGRKQAKHKTVAGNDSSLIRNHQCFSDFQIFFQNRIWSFHSFMASFFLVSINVTFPSTLSRGDFSLVKRHSS